MQTKKTLSDRMKEYEAALDFRIIHRLPIVLRIDGWKFSSFTQRIKVEKPYDRRLSEAMADTAIIVAKKIQGCILGYTQSDEISLVIRTDQSENTTPWFDGRILKMASVAASFATAAFNAQIICEDKASFDCRPVALPNMTEVVNNLIWRQQDATRNSILNAALFDLGKKVGRGTARKMSHGKNTKELQELLIQNGINWNDYPTEYKRGVVVFRKTEEIEKENGTAIRKPWIAEAAPIFTSDAGRSWLSAALNMEISDGQETEEVQQDQGD
jgi:tRNA(His) 5'-end guanylyltransferase